MFTSALDVDNLVLKAATKPPAALLAKLEQHKAEIVALLRREADETASAATSRPSWWPKPPRFHELVHEGGRGRCSPSGMRPMPTPRPCAFFGNAVLTLLDPLAAHQLHNQRLVQRRLSGEVERIEALGLWKVRQPNATLYVAALAVDCAPVRAQAQQIARITGTVLCRFHGDFDQGLDHDSRKRHSVIARLSKKMENAASGALERRRVVTLI